MAKVNVYLPDDLEAEVREAGLSISHICQIAVRDALDRVAGVRDGDAGRARLTPRLTSIINDAMEEMAARGRKVRGDDLLCFIMKHGNNLGARALVMLGVDLPEPRGDLGSKGKGELDAAAQELLIDAYRIALEMRHDHVGTEHVVLAVSQNGGIHGQTLAALGVNPRNLRAQIDKLLANPWTTERVAPEEDTELLQRIERELHRLADEVDRLKDS